MTHASHPQQARFLRRFFAFASDTLIVISISLVLFFAYDEIAARRKDRSGEFSRLILALKENASVRIVLHGAGTTSALTIGDPQRAEGDFKKAYKKKIHEKLGEDEFARASEMSLEEMEKEYPQILGTFPGGRAKVYIIGGEGLSVIYEFICGYLYFIFFFRFGGRTLGKRLFGLKVIDLDGRPYLGWYQAFERTHGYAASTLSMFLGFLQVFWEPEKLTMHDKIARTTVVKCKSVYFSANREN